MADSYSMLRARPYHSRKVRAAAYLGPVFRGSGEGSFAGSFPDGVTSQEGVPTSAEVIVRARAHGTPFDGAVVARVTSNSSGEWLVPRLPEGIAFDVAARKDGECDVVKSNVVPLSPLKLLAPHVFYTPVGVTRTLRLKAIGGEPPYTLSIVGGTPPASLSVDGLDLVATAPTESPGVYPVTLELEDARAETVQIEMEVELVLLRFSFSYPYSARDMVYAITDELFSLVPDLVAPQLPVAFDVVDGVLPTGLSLDPDTGEISGTPTVDGIYTFTIGAEDAQARTHEEEFTIVVAPEGPHQYWRIYITTSSSYSAIRELEFAAAPGGPNQCVDGTPFSNGDYHSSYGPQYAFDGDLNSSWMSNTNSSSAIKILGYQFPYPVVVREARICAYITNSQYPIDFQFQYSDDGTNWVDASPTYNRTSWPSMTLVAYDVG